MSLRLDRLFAANAKNLPLLWQRHCEAIETAYNDLSDQVAAIAAAQAAATAAQAAAVTAQSSADTAQSTADTVTINDKLTSSVIIPADALSATDAGTDATITIANHDRRYGDATTLSVTGGSLTGLAYSTSYAIYYDDPTMANATPTYHSTTTFSNALNNYVAGRHFVGIVTTPASGGAATTGGSVPTGTDPTFHNRFDT